MGKQPEGKVSTAIMKVIRQAGGFAYKVHGSEMQMSGVPDVSAVYKGWSVWVETKMPGNKPSKIQWYRIKQLRDAGALVCVAYSVADVVQMLEHIDSDTHARNDCACLYSAPVDLLAIIDSEWSEA